MKVYCQRESCKFNKLRYNVEQGKPGPKSNRSCAKIHGSLHLSAQGKCLDYEKVE